MSDARLAVLVVAAAMIGVGGLATAWSRQGVGVQGATGEPRSLDFLWRVLPLAFLAFLVVIAAAQGS